MSKFPLGHVQMVYLALSVSAFRIATTRDLFTMQYIIHILLVFHKNAAIAFHKSAAEFNLKRITFQNFLESAEG